MTAIYSHPSSNIRPFDVRRDLLPVADLVETCFGDRLSREGKALVRKMRSSATNKRFKRWAMRAAGRVSMPLSGFVWEEEGALAGTLSFIPFRSFRHHHYLIANVAVHPDHQRQGIGRSLIRSALQDLGTKRLDGIWLQVEDSNQTALNLYTEAGFREVTRRTVWELDPQPPKKNPPSGHQHQMRIKTRPLSHWQQQKTWLEKTYPKAIHWYFPLSLWALRAGMWESLVQFILEGPRLRQWSALYPTGEIAGVLTWQSSSRHTDRLWLAAPPGQEASALEAFFPNVLYRNQFRRTLRLDYPAGQAVSPLQGAGFTLARTLTWMRWEM
ncbi:MAG: Ribosomal-protein-alanine acetyltransferase [Chloroflexi bacterium]|nr:Ribosomal-protein-alanine acetyltransferase [Chloroflexota bacterium]